MRLLTYQMPDEIIAIAQMGEFNEFDLNTFFEATGTGKAATFKYKDDVQKWLDIIRGSYMPGQIDAMKMGRRPPFPYSDARLLPYMQHSFWFLPNVAACQTVVATTRHALHDFRRTRVEGQAGGQHHAD